MHIRATNRTAFVIAAGLLAAGLLVFYTSPTRACEMSDCKRIVLAQNADQEELAQSDAETAPEAAPDTRESVKKSWRRARKSARSRKPGRLASEKRSTTDKSSEQGDDRSIGGKPGVSSSVANANAWMAGTAKTVDEFINSLPERSGLTDSASTPEQTSTSDANVQIVASDQLNDLDRAASEQIFMAQMSEPEAQPRLSANSGVDNSLNQASLIGKIFIAFGGFLTLASAARMLIV
jgi:hypothetical protein